MPVALYVRTEHDSGAGTAIVASDSSCAERCHLEPVPVTRLSGRAAAGRPMLASQVPAAWPGYRWRWPVAWLPGAAVSFGKEGLRSAPGW